MNTVVRIICVSLLFLLGACSKNSSDEVLQADVVAENAIQRYLLDHNQTATRDVSGLYYIVLKPGDSTHFVKATSIPSVIYTNYLITGEVVGVSLGDTDFDQRMMKNHILGWQIGLQKISQGGKIRLYIPSNLAYGSVGVPGIIPPNAILISDLELVSIR
ncbi:FKBP-type peptidyl-prolyl cis-trans isomerase [Chitinophaga sp.]|uniref:FKBP-type peptidyl-prolyl cis-trans isomerase n=1 Tax=Chitinophaga sp. TaxID=1869181 RepID=UPI002C8038F0|nr:FKBP-type peptidyl-prolyl cis-trans isomerase [Chitinophaga sp.]HWV67918.1 FKBP-type peptidyl-prolyl cis-trans isomerase [Chitinophaga sp.]